MKNLLLSFAFLTTAAFASGKTVQKNYTVIDTIKLMVDTNHNAYYQNAVKVAGNIITPLIYERALQFMAAKSFAQNYGDDQEWKLIFTTSQDLNINKVYIGDDNDSIDPYTVQFAITLDLKDSRYRYTINNVVFFIPTETYNKRETLFDVYTKAKNTESKRVAKNATALLSSFERYLTTLTSELKQGIERKGTMYHSIF